MPPAVLVPLLKGSFVLLALLRVVMVCALGIATAIPTLAQSTEEAPLVVGTFRLPASNFSIVEADGARTGFFLSLAQEISTEIGVPIEWRDYETVAEMIGAQIQGETDMIAGIARLAEIAPDQIYSNPVGTGGSRLMVRANEAARIGADGIVGQRIGYVPPFWTVTSAN